MKEPKARQNFLAELKKIRIFLGEEYALVVTTIRQRTRKGYPNRISC
jgi:hypothetical protein